MRWGSALAAAGLLSSLWLAVHRRELLGFVVDGCGLAYGAIGWSFPCVEFRTDPDGQSLAILKALTHRSHFVAVAASGAVGVEDPAAHSPLVPFWRWAWESRHLVAGTLGLDPRTLHVGLAVNSKGARSQDRLHIHLDCVRTDVLESLRKLKDAIGRDWQPLPVDLRHQSYWVRRIDEREFHASNPLTAVFHGPIGFSDRSEGTLAVIPVDPTGETGFYLLARNARDERYAAERLLDHFCKVASR